MEFTQFGTIYLLFFVFLSYIMYAKKDKFNYNTYIIILLFFLTNVLIFDTAIIVQFYDSQITVTEMSFYLNFVVAFFILIRNGISKNQKIFLLFSVLYIIVNNILIVINPATIPSVTLPNLWYDFFNFGIFQFPKITKYVLIYDIYTLLSVLILFSIYNTLKANDYFKLTKWIGNLAYLSLIIFIAEFAIRAISSPEFFYAIRNIFMGVNIDSVDVLHRGGVIPYYGFNSEPASLARALLIIALSANLTSKRGNIVVSSIVLLLGLFSGSMLFLVFFIFICAQIIFMNHQFIHTIFRKNSKSVISLVLLVFIALGFIVINFDFSRYFIERLSNVVKILSGESVVYNSEMSRITTSLTMFKIFISRPIFGAGIGTTYGFSSLFNFLSNFGLIGLTGLLFMVKKIIGPIINYGNFIFHSFLLVLILSIQGNINTFIFTISICYIIILKTASNYSNTEELIV